MDRLRLLLNQQMVSAKTTDVFLNEICNRPTEFLVQLVKDRESLNNILNQMGVSPGFDRVGVVSALEMWSQEYESKKQLKTRKKKEEIAEKKEVEEKEEMETVEKGNDMSDENSIIALLDDIGNFYHRDVSSYKKIFEENWITTAGQIRGASTDAWLKWQLPSTLADEIKKRLNIPSPPSQTQGVTTKKEKVFIDALRLGNSQNLTLEQALQKILNGTDLILDEIQHQWESDPLLLRKIIQIVDRIKPPHQLVLVGTPVLGKIDVSFDGHTSGRLKQFHVSSLSGIEVYALLNKCTLGTLDFNIFLSLWSCFDGVPGLYEIAFNSHAFTGNSLKEKEVLQILTTSVPIQSHEREWVLKSQNGFVVSNTDMQDPTLLRLKTLGILIQFSNIVYLRDKVIIAYVIASNDKMTKEEQLQNLRGYGLETLTKSVAPQIFMHLKISDFHLFQEVARGYGKCDLDGVFAHKGRYIIFSCKVNPKAHALEFLNNIQSHFENEKPTMITLILCSPTSIPIYVKDMFIRECVQHPFNWHPHVRIEIVDLSAIIPLSARQLTFLEGTHHWPILIRKQVVEEFKENQHRILHIIGRRRVGKTTLVKITLPKAKFIDFNEILPE